MGNNYTKLSVRPKTKKLLMEAAKQVYLQHHPDHAKFKITEDFMVEYTATFYIED